MKIAIQIEEVTVQKYRAWCPALPGCAVIGGSLQEAQKRLHEAVLSYIASLDASAPARLDMEVCGHVPVSAETVA